MTTIGGVTGAVPTTSPSIAPGAGLDGETILMYCQTQLNDLNGQIKAKMAQQRAAREQKELINELRTLLGTYAEKGILSHMWMEKKELLQKYAELIQKLPPGATRNALQASFDKFRSTACNNNDVVASANVDHYLKGGEQNIDKDIATKEKTPDVKSEQQQNTVSPREVTEFMKHLEDAGDEIGKNAELEMISLQQVVSQRQMAIQMSTNLMSKFMESLQGIIANTGK